MYPDGHLQAFERQGADEYLCQCGEWVPVSESPCTREHYYGTWYSQRCKRCWDIKMDAYRQKRREFALRERWRMTRTHLRELNVISPVCAGKFVRAYRGYFGGTEGLAQTLCKIIDKAANEDDTKHLRTAIKAFELYLGIHRLSDPEEFAEHLLREERSKPPTHPLYYLPF